MKTVVIETLRSILQSNPEHKLFPSAVVDAARDPESPLHQYFDWDDTTAAHEYRLSQARNLIASVEIISDTRRESTPVFVSLLVDRKKGGYREVKEVLSSKALHSELLRTAVEELRAMRQRYDRLVELAGVFKAVKKVEHRLESEQRKGRS